MKYEPRKKLNSANFAAHFYAMMLKADGLKVYLEYKINRCRLDAVVVKGDEIIAIVEAKSYNEKNKKINFATRQFAKYSALGVPLYYIRSFESAEELANKIKLVS